jgi:hypothetical protein
MKIVAYELCRVMMLFPLEEVVPLGGVNDPDVIEKVQERYHFKVGPDLKSEEVAKNGYKFESGYFQFNSATVRIIDFALYRDGIVINGIKTDGMEAFLEDVITYMQKTFLFRDFNTKPRRYFQSQIVVEFERSPEKLIRSIEEITSAISRRLKPIYETEVPMNLARIDFDIDKIGMAPQIAAAVQRFIIERRLGIAFDKERYFCAAPMRTEDHVAVLEEIEGLIS